MLPTSHESWINLLIMNEMKKIEPSLKPQGVDQKIFHICCADFRNYSDFLEENSKHSVSSSVPPMVTEIHLTTKDSVGDECSRVDYQIEVDSAKKVVEFVQMWVRRWWKKYKQRVQITIKKVPAYKPSKTRQRGIKMMKKFSKEEIDDIKKAIVHTLIKNDEICCTDILADASFKGVLGRYSKKKSEWTPEKKLNFMASVLREVKRMSRTRGVLVFIKPDKKYYELREFRDDNATNII